MAKSWFKYRKPLIIYCLMIFPSTKSKIDLIIRFTTTKQLENSFFHQFIFSPTLETNFQQLYSSDKIMVLVWKTLIIYCLIIFPSTKNKNDLITGFPTFWSSWKPFSFNNLYAPTHRKLLIKLICSSDKILVPVWKTLIIYCLMISPSTKSKKGLIIGFTTSKQFETTLFHQFIFSDTLETISKQLYSSDKIMVHVWKALIIYCLMIFPSTKSKNNWIIGFTTSKQLGTTLFQ